MLFRSLGISATTKLSPSDRKSSILQLKRRSGLMVQAEAQAFELFAQSSVFKKFGYQAFPQVHLMQVFDLDVPALLKELKTRKVWPEYMDGVQNAVAAKWKFALGWRSVDFLICDNKMKVVGAIEIDDSRHSDEPAVVASDALKNIVFASTRLALLRLKNREISKLFNLPAATRDAAFTAALRNARISWDSFVSALK